MKLFNKIASFRRGQDGAVTVDWVVLTAAIVGLAVAVFAAIRPSIEDITTDIKTNLDTVTVDTKVGQ